MQAARRTWILGIIACLATAGCRGLGARTATVVPQIAAVGPADAAAIESASLLYARASGPTPSDEQRSAPVGELSISSASYVTPATQPPGDAAMVATTCTSDSIVVLAVRFPHPDGRRDIARAELIVADRVAEAKQSTSWRSRISRAIDANLPGVEWGPGIRNAKGLDVPMTELQKILQPKSVVADTSGSSLTSLPGARLVVNGQPGKLPAASSPAVNALATRVAHEGRIISYPGNATELLSAVGCP